MPKTNSPKSLYADLINANPEIFRNTDGGIEVVIDPARVAECEAAAAESMPTGLPETWQQTGMLYCDGYYSFIKDAVIFPDGRKGTYTRILVNKVRGSGVAVFCIQDNKVLLLRQFRHATREFHYSIPRGFGEAGATPLESVQREVSEEISCSVESFEELGQLHPDSGLLGDDTRLYLARVIGAPRAETAEAIKEVVAITVAEFVDMIRIGAITDSFTLAAFSFLICSGKIIAPRSSNEEFLFG